MSNGTHEEIGPISFASDHTARRRIAERVQEVLDAYREDPRWGEIEASLEGYPDRAFGAMFGAHIGSNYALRLDGRPIRLLVVGKDSYEKADRGVHEPNEFIENYKKGLTSGHGPNWAGVQTVVWNVLQRGSELPKTLPYYVEVDGDSVPWLSCAAFTNRYQRAVVILKNGKRQRRSISDKSPTSDKTVNARFRQASAEVYAALLRALEPTHIVFHGRKLPEIDNIAEKPSERLGPYGRAKRFRMLVNGETVEGAALDHPASSRFGDWYRGKGRRYAEVVHPLLATLLDGDLPRG